MGKKLVSKTAKVLSETKRSKDKEAIAIAYEHIPRNPKEQEHGSIYAVIELEDAGGHAEEIAEQIIDVLHNEYYEDTDKNPLESFESSLAKINETLAERSSEGQIHWLGKMNAILAVLTDNMLHVTQAGKAEAYLYRGEHAMHITEDLAGDSVNPLRTFINVASGELSENDRMVLVTPGVFYKLSKSELKKFATSGSPINAASDISKIIAGENGSSQPNAILILEMVSPEAFAASSEETEKEPAAEVWVTPETRPLDVASENTLHGAAKVFDFIGKATSSASAFITTRAYPIAKKGVQKVVKQIKSFRKEKDAEKIIIESEEKIHPQSEKLYSDLETDTDDGILIAPNEDNFEREIRIKESEQKPKRVSLERFNFSFLSKAKDGLSSAGKRFSMPKGKYSYIYLGAAILVVVGLFGFLAYNNNIQNKKTEADNLYNQAKTKYETALTNISSGDKLVALEDLKIAEGLAENAAKTDYKKTDAEALLKKITETKDLALGIIRNSANMFFDFSKENLDGLYYDGKIFYTLNFSDGSVYSLDPASKLTATIVDKPNIDGKISFATFIESRKTIVAYTDSKEIYEIDLVSKKATKQNVSGGVPNAIDISSYGTNIYLLSPEDNQIYKHTKISGGYGKKTNYITSTGEDLSTAVSIAIDSDIYVISNDGFIKKYTSGKRQTFNPNNLPENITDPKNIYADPIVAGLYIVAQKNKLIKIDDKQNFSAQYISSDLKDIKDLVVIDDTSLIYVLSGGKIYTVNF